MSVFLNQIDSGYLFTSAAIGCWYLVQQFGSSGYVWLRQHLGSEQGVSMFLMGACPLIGFILYGIIQYYVDMSAGFAGFRARYKIQPKYHPDNTAYWKAVKVAARNWIVLGFPYAMLLSWVICPLRGCDSGPEMPSALTWLWQFAIFAVCEEFLFYYSHKKLHEGAYYKSIHKLHHEYTAPFGIAAVYAHPIEHFLSNMLPVSFGPLICGSHPVVAGFWSTFAVLVTMTSHSGYHVPGMPNPLFHDWHHMKFTENYGVLGWLDHLYGSSKNFAAAMKNRKEGEPLYSKKDEAESADYAAKHE